MAATQAEKQQNDVSGEKVQPDLNVRNTLLQNGTDKGSVRSGCGVVINKTKNTGPKSLGLDMSQYRSESGGGDSEQSLNDSIPNSEYSTATSANVGPAEGDGHSGYSIPFGEGGFHFAPRQSYGGTALGKQPSGPGPQPPTQRIFSGQAISQPTGPTPTLNQLLQSNNTVTRYQNNYGHPEPPYGQSWAPQKPIAPYSNNPPTSVYRNQQTLSPGYSGSSSSSPGYGEGRSGWAGPPVTGQHGPGSPGPPSSSTAANQPSPQPSQPPSHSPGPGLPPSPQHQPPTASSHQGFPSRPAQPTTPNAHAPDQADLSGGNSNDSSGGAAPGTPNSQGMRPTPSPTGSTGSRSMSPAVGQPNIPQPPRPSSGQSDGSGNSRMSHSPIATQGSQSTYPPHHVHPGYKGHPGMVSQGVAGQPLPLYQPNQQYSQGAYPARPPGNMQYQGYAPGSQAPPSNHLPPQQYANRGGVGVGVGVGAAAPNHMANSQFPPYQQQWPGTAGSSSGSGNHVTPSVSVSGGKGNSGGGAPPQASSPSSGTPRQPHYLKQHLHHKMGFMNVPPSSMPPSPSPPQNYHMGPPPVGHHLSGMGPPASMGPPPTTSPLMTNNHPQPPPSSTPNSHNQMGSDMMDNGITTIASGNLSTNVTSAAAGSVTSVVTTGPDGTPVDEGSQQSTLSNASAASGEDPQCPTSKVRKNDMGHYSHPTTPQSTVPSSPAASMNSHEEYEQLSNPSWPRTPASPVFNSHVPPTDTYRSKKTDSLSKLYEMDDSPERRAWLDKLLAFMEERRSPITTCPTISKNPLDLFRLYVYVKERGGFMEVTKNKTWKDIAGMLGIGASSSAAYTLRKHYTKNLLAYECQFDRGGIDPQPIISQVEASSKKKGAKAASVPSPGSSNSQDSFPAPGSGGQSMDGYSGYGYPPGTNPDFNPPAQRPTSQTSTPSPHGGTGGANHMSNTTPTGASPAGGPSDNVNVSNPFDDVSPSPPPRGGPFPSGTHPPYSAGTPPRPQGQGQGYAGQGGYNQYPGPGPGAPPDQYSGYAGGTGYASPRPVYTPYSGESTTTSGSNTQGVPAQAQDSYTRYGMGGTPGSGYSSRAGYGGGAPGSGGPPASQPPTSYASQQDYYRPDQQNYPNQQGNTGSGNYPGVQPNKNMPPPPRRHPDFAKDQQGYPQYGQQRPQMYGGWTNNNQFRGGQYGGSGPGAGAQQWTQGGRPTGQWDRFSPNQGYQPSPQGNQQWSGMQTPGVPPNSALRPPMGSRPGKPFGMQPQQPGKSAQPQVPPSGSYNQNQLPKREITFPPESVEATVPVLYRRKRICRTDLGSVDAWRMIMCLRSGLLLESCYALDVLNVLLFDDTSVGYFCLNQWHGLLDLLLEHLRKSLSDMFDAPFPRRESDKEGKDAEEELEVDLGGVVCSIDPDSRTLVLNKTENYTLNSRKGCPIRLIDRNEDIFVRDHHKSWDTKGDAAGINLLAEVITDPWHQTSEHILPTFQAEFGRIPFNRKLEDKIKKEAEFREEKDDETSRTPPPPPEITNISDKSKRRTKTLSDVISRIKKETAPEENDTTPSEIKGHIKTELVSDELKSVDVDVDLKTAAGGINGSVNCLNIRDTACTLKRRRMSDYEDEAYSRDDASLVLLTESQDCVGKRCVCISNILRSLTFIPGNEIEFARSSTFLALVGKLLLFHHEHPLRTLKTRNYDREEDADFSDSCSSLQGEGEWWWDFLLQIRENILVSTANIAGQINLDQYPEEVARPLLDGLLHWAICPSAQGQDPFQSVVSSSLLSPQRLALEALCKLCVTNNNVDLVIATPPFSRLERLCAVLTKHLCRSEDQVLREFSINLLHYLAAADSCMARVVASQQPCVSLLVAFIEQAEMSALGVANQHGISALRDNPDSMGTSLDMLRRAASTLVFLAEHPDNRPLLVQQESRLLALVMSQILDQQVALLLSKVLYKISHS